MLLTAFIAQADVEKLMASQGISVDKDALKNLFAALADTSVVDAIAAGSKKTASMPSGGARAAAPTAGAGGDAPAEEKLAALHDLYVHRAKVGEDPISYARIFFYGHKGHEDHVEEQVEHQEPADGPR